MSTVSLKTPFGVSKLTLKLGSAGPANTESALVTDTVNVHLSRSNCAAIELLGSWAGCTLLHLYTCPFLDALKLVAEQICARGKWGIQIDVLPLDLILSVLGIDRRAVLVESLQQDPIACGGIAAFGSVDADCLWCGRLVGEGDRVVSAVAAHHPPVVARE